VRGSHFPALFDYFNLERNFVLRDKMKSRLSRYFFRCTRLLLGAVFIAASIDKIAHPGAFAKIVSNYQILPGHLVNILAIVLPWLEAILGLFILCGWWLPGATILANLLLLAFFGAIAQAVARGIDINCGCFSTKAAGSPHPVWYLARDSLFLLLGVIVMVQAFRARSAVIRKPDIN
jgi:uncharacterized membrane protein YphA (DoxX/SURF4 family)